MISNIGFNDRGTHTLSNNHPFANLPHAALPEKLIHPNFFVANRFADEFTLSIEIPNLALRLYREYKLRLLIKLKRYLNK